MHASDLQVRKDSRLFAELCAAILCRGHHVKFSATGQSMQPNLLDGDTVLVAPIHVAPLQSGDIALVENSEGLRVHRVTQFSEEGSASLIRSDTGNSPDPAPTQVFGKVISLSRAGREQNLSSWQLRVVHPLASLTRRIFLAGRRRIQGIFGAHVALLIFAAAFLCVPIASAQNADLSLTQSVVPTVIAPGNSITYSETVTNNGAGSATSPVIYQQTPTNTTFVSITAPANWTCTAPAVGGTGQVNCTWTGNGGVFTNGSIANFTYVVQVNAGTAAGTTIVNSANVTSLTTDGTPQNNATTTTVRVESATGADLAISMVASPSPVFVGSTLTYTIQVQNLGLVGAANVTVSDTIPGTTTFVSASPAGSCTQTASVVCNLGTLANGASTKVTIVVTTPFSPSTLSNTATAATTTTDPVAGNNSITVATVAQPLSCATPGKDGTGTNITGTVNRYYPPSTATTLAAGSNTVTLGASRGVAGGAIAIGDLLLIIQMQDATIQSTNNSSYGDGLPGDPATGWLNLNSSGKYEFVTATSAVATGGGTLTFTGTGANGGALNTYTSAAYGTNGQKTFQVIRVPQYTKVTIGAALTALAWNGATGGVLAIDVATQLDLNTRVATTVSSLGFRGGAGVQLGGQAGALATDYVTLATATTNGSKGEGIAGTPHFTANAAITAVTDNAVEGYPNGSYSRGAPATAGAGATDAHPTANDENSGGGGGGNGGNGGYGGYGWNTAGIVGGHFGSAFPFSANVITMGGGGGAGTTNNGTANPANVNAAGINSSGSAGGGIIIVRAGSLIGTGTLSANGQNALNVDNDGGGGGGAAGTIIVFSNSGSLTGLTVNAIGGNGGTTWPGQAPAAFPGNRHGPGGGGGGGAVLVSSAPAAVNVAGGTNGYSTTAQDAYGATPGLPGASFTNLTITQTPGTQSGAYCVSTDLSVTNSGLPIVVLPAANITYTQSAINNGAFDAVNAVFSEAVPVNTTFQSIVTPAGWTCTTPAVGATGNINCTNPDFTAGLTSPFTVVVKVNVGTTIGTQIVDVDNITSGTTDPNLANNSATAINTVGTATSADVAITNTSSAAITNAGGNVTMTGVVTNNGPAAATSLAFTEPIPTNTTFQSMVVPAGWNCAPLPGVGTSGGTVTCTIASLASGGTATFPLVLGVPLATPSGTVITATDNIFAATPDANPANNLANATTVVATAGQIDLVVSASDTPDPVSQSNNISYTQTVTNNGPIAETNATFKVTIPANTTLAATFTPPANWTCNAIAVGATGTFTCTLNGGQTIASGASVNFPMVVKVNPATPSGTIITDSPSVSSTIGDPNPANNTVSITTAVASPTQSDVSIAKTASPEPVNQGTTLVYSLMVRNAGPAIAQGVTVTDTLPGEVSFASVSTAQGSCSFAAGTVTCTLGSLGVGSSVLITINVNPNTFSANTLSSNTASVSSTTSDPNSSNNSSTAVSSIQSPTAVDISSFHAFLQPDGSVLLEWRTQEESRNLGFHIFREQSGARQRISPALIAGSALLLRGSLPQHAAKLYRWVDSNPAPGSAYWIEDVDINGTRTMHGPASVESASSIRAASAFAVSANTKVSPLLRELHPAATVATTPQSLISRPLVTPRPPIPALPAGTTRITVADHDAIKISVDHEGWYRVSFADLISAGLDPNFDSRSLRLFAEGVEQPMHISPGNRLWNSPGGALEFYGTGIDTPFSAERVYWLIRDHQSGKRIPVEPLLSSGGASPNSFPFTVVREDRTTYFAALLNGENNDNFFGAVVTSDPVDQDLELAHIDSSSALPVTLDITLQGGTDAQDHRVSVALNGATIGFMEFFGQILTKQTFSVDSSLLQEGSNTVTLTALNGDNDVSVVQSIQLHYSHTFVADGNWLRASAPAGSALHLSGFSDPQIQLFDITDPLNILAISGKVSSASGSYNVDFVLPGSSSADRTILAFSASAVSAPLALAHHTPTFLDDRRRGADVVIISHPDFVAALAPLVQLRESQNHRVLVVTTDQLYDEYNFGERSPIAIKNFLKDASTRWRPKVQSVLLVGDASFDPRNYLGLGSFDFVPTRMIETAAFKTASDDWFTDFQSIGYATLPTGRLPVRTIADAQLVVSKIINYENGADAGPWNAQALLVADQDPSASFSTAIDSAAANLPASLQASEIFADGQDPASVRAQLLASLNSGSLLVNYQGHGSQQQWSFSNLFDSNDATALANGGRLPVYLLMDCLNGFFQDVYADSLAESLLLSPNGGAVAVWASSGFTDQAPQATMNLSLLSQLSAHPNESLGQLLLQAKSGTSDNDVRRTWILFGDPSMKLHFDVSSAPSNTGSSRTIPIIPRRITPVCARSTACSKGMLPQ